MQRMVEETYAEEECETEQANIHPCFHSPRRMCSEEVAEDADAAGRARARAPARVRSDGVFVAMLHRMVFGSFRDKRPWMSRRHFA